MQLKEYSTEVGGKTFTAQFTDLADQANGSVIVRYGQTVVLATAVISKTERVGGDYLPLTVDYEERFYASGQILGSRFMRREGRPSDEAILSGRVVDRTIRPLFEGHIRNDIQVVITILSLQDEDPDVLAVTAASLALATSDIPWNGPVSAVRVGKKIGNWDFLVNPTYTQRDELDYEMDMTVCGKDGNINMIELGGKEVKEDTARLALEKASEEIEKLQAFQKKIIADIGKVKKVIERKPYSEPMKKLFIEKILGVFRDTIFSGAGGKKTYDLESSWVEMLKTELPDEDVGQARKYFNEQVDMLLHTEAIDFDSRPDGRKMTQLRELYAQAGGLSPNLHGTGIFYRGGTHVLSVLTLGGPSDSQIVDGMEVQEKKRYMHHYNFPPFSSGETGRMGGMNRRMIGHGALAEKALVPVLPAKEDFPYTIRIVSESMASNGSTSMASVCGSTLSLMDGGVPIKTPVAGIAMGLMMRDEKTYKVLVDIQGPEDHHGDMDLKVAGTRDGITAIQMDVKVNGIPVKILGEAFEKAKGARLQILDVIEKSIPTPRADISSYAPKIIAVKILVDQIGMVIGPGGKMVNKIREETGAEIDIEDDGTVFITGKNGAAEAAKKIIEGMTRVYKAGERFMGTVTRLMEFGAFVKIGPTTEGLVHISEIAPFRVTKVSDIIKEGDVVPVVIKEIDEKSRINLSIKKADPNFAKEKPGKTGMTQ